MSLSAMGLSFLRQSSRRPRPSQALFLLFAPKIDNPGFAVICAVVAVYLEIGFLCLLFDDLANSFVEAGHATYVRKTLLKTTVGAARDGNRPLPGRRTTIIFHDLYAETPFIQVKFRMADIANPFALYHGAHPLIRQFGLFSPVLRAQTGVCGVGYDPSPLLRVTNSST